MLRRSLTVTLASLVRLPLLSVALLSVALLLLLAVAAAAAAAVIIA